MKKRILLQSLILVSLFLTAGLAFSQEKFGGLTLYTVRGDMGKDAAGTLGKVAEVGCAAP